MPKGGYAEKDQIEEIEAHSYDALERLSASLERLPDNHKRRNPAGPTDFTPYFFVTAKRYCVATCEVLAPGYGRDILTHLFGAETDKKMGPVKEKFERILSETACVYLRTPDDVVRAIMFAQLCGLMNRVQLNKLLDDTQIKMNHIGLCTIHTKIGRYRYNTGKELNRKLNSKGELPTRDYASRLSEQAAKEMLEWIRAHCPLGWKPGAVKTYRVQSKRYDVHRLNRSSGATELWRLYSAAKKRFRVENETSEWLPGRGTFMTLLKYVTEQTSSKACLSYYYIRLLDTFEYYDKLVEDMETLQNAGYEDLKEMNGGKPSID